MARSAFPCFDQPNKKASITVQAVRPSQQYRALSNMNQVVIFLVYIVHVRHIFNFSIEKIACIYMLTNINEIWCKFGEIYIKYISLFSLLFLGETFWMNFATRRFQSIFCYIFVSVLLLTVCAYVYWWLDAVLVCVCMSMLVFTHVCVCACVFSVCVSINKSRETFRHWAVTLTSQRRIQERYSALNIRKLNIFFMLAIHA